MCSVEKSPWGAGKGVWPRPLGEHRALCLPLATLAGCGRQPIIGWVQQVSVDWGRSRFYVSLFGKKKGGSWIRSCTQIEDVSCRGTGWSPFLPLTISSNFQNLSACNAISNSVLCFLCSSLPLLVSLRIHTGTQSGGDRARNPEKQHQQVLAHLSAGNWSRSQRGCC